jgi:hypothetical protein
VSEVMDDLITLSDVFETSMEFEESGTSIDKTENKLVLSGGGSYKMTKNLIRENHRESRRIKSKYY